MPGMGYLGMITSNCIQRKNIMGLWSFVKDAGKKIFGGDDEKEVQGAALQDELKNLGLESEGLDIQVAGDKVTVSGKAVSQEMKEKVILAVGNVEGVAAVEEDIEGGDGDGTFHTVEKGDTLWAIAEKTLGNGARYTEIFEANKPMLTDPDKIYPGQMLRIPAK
ncbi:LysM/phospholipid-binding domain protein [Roseobacter sp. GAI101]|nr:LysM/phospholipid-binding domain protein [Roseobacter sp. GAI101]